MKAYRKVDDTYVFRVDSGRLVLLGVGAGLVVCLVFLVGVLVGRGLWSRRPVPGGLVVEAPQVTPVPETAVPEPPGRTQPELTFYKELKKPGVGPSLPVRTVPISSRTSNDRGTPVPPAPVTEKPKASSSPPVAEAKSAVRARPSKNPVKRPPPAVFTVQVGSFRNRSDAVAWSKKVGSHGVRARVVDASVAGRTWYRVQVGRFDTRSKAEAHYRKQLEARGIQGFVTTR